MRFTTALVFTASAALVAAQDSSCAAENIVTACLASTTPQLQACGSNDWGCLCNQSINVLTCYNNCPGDARKTGASQQSESYCNAAKAYPSSSSSLPIAAASATAAPATSASPTLPAGVTPSSSSSAAPAATGATINGGNSAASSSAHSGACALAVNVAALVGALALAVV